MDEHSEKRLVYIIPYVLKDIFLMERYMYSLWLHSHEPGPDVYGKMPEVLECIVEGQSNRHQHPQHNGIDYPGCVERSERSEHKYTITVVCMCVCVCIDLLETK